MYSKTVPCFQMNTASTNPATIKGGMMICWSLDVRSDVVDPIGKMRVVLDEVGHSRIRLVAQELDQLRMVARARHPAAALLDPVLSGLRLKGSEADMVDDKLLHPVRSPITQT